MVPTRRRGTSAASALRVLQDSRPRLRAHAREQAEAHVSVLPVGQPYYRNGLALPATLAYLAWEAEENSSRRPPRGDAPCRRSSTSPSRPRTWTRPPSSTSTCSA